MRRILNTLFLILTPILLMCGGQGGNPADASDGRLVITFNNQVKTILPDISMDIASYRVSGSGPEGVVIAEQTIAASQGQLTLTGLASGTWTITVDGINNSGDAIGTGSGSETVYAGVNTVLEITVSPFSGNGSMSITATWSEALADPSVTATLTSSTGQATDIIVTPGSGSVVCSNTSLPAGYYTLSLQLFDNGSKKGGLTESVRIVQGETTLASIPFKDSSASQIIADHTIISKYADIPDYYIGEVKKMLLIVAGESHSRAYTRGLQLLATENSRYRCVWNDNEPEDFSTTHLRTTNYYYNADYEGGKYKGTCSEHDFWSSSTNISTASSMIRRSIQYQRTQGNPYSAIGFGWCWDMAFSIYGSPTVDPVYGVHWYGATDGELGTTPSVWWGLDSGDSAINMDTYIAVVQSLMTVDSGTVVFFTTGPVDSSWCQEESGYQNYIKNQYLRDRVSTINGAVLFDFADILAYNDAGVMNTVSWNGHTYPFIHPDNMTPSDSPDYHFGQNGSKRIAKAMWWMLARIAGWDGN